MVIYRPHRGSLEQAMAEAREFNGIKEMKEAIVASWNGAFDVADVVVKRKSVNDTRIGWEDTKYVCVKRIGNEKYRTPQCIGMCATRYRK